MMLGNGVVMPDSYLAWKGLTDWKLRMGDCVQDLREALFPECSFSCPSGRRNEGERASRVVLTE